MSTIIQVSCIDQVLAFVNTPVIASGGLEEDYIRFTFCSKWDGLQKTAVFWRSEDDVYHVMLDDAGSCQVPPEVLAQDGVIYFGVFGVNAAGKQRTSEVLTYRIVKGAITTGTKPSDPTPDIYTQLLAKYDAMLQLAAELRAEEAAFEEEVTQRQATHEQTVAAGQAAFETALSQQVTTDQEAFEEEILAMIAAGLLPDNSVATEKLKDGAVTLSKLSSDVTSSIDAVETSVENATERIAEAEAEIGAVQVQIGAIKEAVAIDKLVSTTLSGTANRIDLDFTGINVADYVTIEILIKAKIVKSGGSMNSGNLHATFNGVTSGYYFSDVKSTSGTQKDQTYMELGPFQCESGYFINSIVRVFPGTRLAYFANTVSDVTNHYFYGGGLAKNVTALTSMSITGAIFGNGTGVFQPGSQITVIGYKK